jgi:hypothetical protein
VCLRSMQPNPGNHGLHPGAGRPVPPRAPERDSGTENRPGAMTVAVAGYYVRAYRDATALACADISSGMERRGDTSYAMGRAQRL